jgi:hypothetical protein
VEPIKVWPWSEAPTELKALSPHGGDEDWVALIPARLAGKWIGWCDPNIAGTPFGCAGISEHQLSDGSIVRIGAHA